MPTKLKWLPSSKFENKTSVKSQFWDHCTEFLIHRSYCISFIQLLVNLNSATCIQYFPWSIILNVKTFYHGRWIHLKVNKRRFKRRSKEWNSLPWKIFLIFSKWKKEQEILKALTKQVKIERHKVWFTFFRSKKLFFPSASIYSTPMHTQQSFKS